MKNDEIFPLTPHSYIDELYARAIAAYTDYRSLLEKEREAITARDADKIEEYLRVDEETAVTIGEIMKCISACEADFSKQGSMAGSQATAVTARLREELERISAEVRTLIDGNRDLCAFSMTEIETERNNLTAKTTPPSPFNKIANPGIIDITR
jgi:hypothetical protein